MKFFIKNNYFISYASLSLILLSMILNKTDVKAHSDDWIEREKERIEQNQTEIFLWTKDHKRADFLRMIHRHQDSKKICSLIAQHPPIVRYALRLTVLEYRIFYGAEKTVQFPPHLAFCEKHLHRQKGDYSYDWDTRTIVPPPSHQRSRLECEDLADFYNDLSDEIYNQRPFFYTLYEQGKSKAMWFSLFLLSSTIVARSLLLKK